jgi:hypothetical protein
MNLNPFYHFARWRAIRHARAIIKTYIAAACRGDSLACQQVSRASYLLKQYNK